MALIARSLYSVKIRRNSTRLTFLFFLRHRLDTNQACEQFPATARDDDEVEEVRKDDA